MTTLDVKKMADAAVHYGHKTQRWNPRMAPYIYGEKNGIHIFDLDKTVKAVEKALDFLKKSAASGSSFLFVCTKPQGANFVKEAAEGIGAHCVVKKWVPGLLTNYDTVKKRIEYLRKLKKMKAEGELDKYTKKEVSKMMKEVEKLEMALGGVEELKELPDVVIVFDVVRDDIAVKEAQKLRIPVVGVCDTNADPSVDYPVPGNDDAVKALQYFVDLFVGSIKSGTKK